MNRIIIKMIVVAAALVSTSVFAQTISIGSVNGVAGQQVIVPVTFTSGAQSIGNFTVDISFVGTNFSVAEGDCSVANVNQTQTSCSGNAGINLLRVTMARGSGSLTTGLAANLKMTIVGNAAPGPLNLTPAMNAIGFAGQDLPLDAIAVTPGVITVLGPVYSSTPPPGAGGATEFAFGPVIEGTPVASQGLTIENTGAAGTTLSGLCSLTSNPDGAFLTNGDLGDEPFSSTTTPPAVGIISVSCNTNLPWEGSVYSGTLTCSHNGTNLGDAIYDLTCNITDGPHPAFTANPTSLIFNAVEAGDVMPPQNSTVTNTGDTPSNLVTAPACTLMGTNAGSYSLSGQTSYDIDTAGSAVLTVQCTATDPGDYNDALVSCPHTDAIAGTGQIGLECHVGDPGPAKFNSTPVLPGDPIDMTPNGDVLTGSANPVFTNTIFNDTQDPNDSDLFINCFFTGGGGAITETTNNAGVFIAPGDSVPSSFACDTSTAGDFTATYSCDYSTDGINDPDDGSASYAVNCHVRDPISEVVPDPASGTTLQFLIQPAGTGTVSVDFDQILNEAGADDAFVNDCWIDGTDEGAFAITSPLSFPQAIAPLGTVTVTVEGTDNNGQDSYSATLHCAYSDSSTDYCEVGQTGGGDAPAGDVECEVASYPLLMEVGGDATFRVSKDFTDGVNPTLVDVTLSCFTGLPLVQTQTISETQDVNFIVQSFDSGELDCSITEDLDLLPGYTPVYLSGGDTESTNDVGGCNFDNVVGGDENSCRITNNAKPVDVTLEKVWIIEGSGGDFIDKDFTLTLSCDTLIAGGSTNCGGGYGLDAPDNHNDTWCIDYTGTGDTKFVAKVTPKYPSSNCSVKETIYDDAVDSYLGDCPPMVIKANQGASCKVTNTVFFEGIPTLNQYGLAILALLMLGMGMVGFRRFV